MNVTIKSHRKFLHNGQKSLRSESGESKLRVEDDLSIRRVAKIISELEQVSHRYIQPKAVASLEPAKKIINSHAELQMSFIKETIAAITRIIQKHGPRREMPDPMNPSILHAPGYPCGSAALVEILLRTRLPFTEADMLEILDSITGAETDSRWHCPCLNSLIDQIELHAFDRELGRELKEALISISQIRALTDDIPSKKLQLRVGRLCKGKNIILIDPGEAWADRALEDLAELNAEKAEAWADLFELAQASDSAHPSAKWLSEASRRLDGVGHCTFVDLMLRWFPLVDEPRTQVIESWPSWSPNPNLLLTDWNAAILRGLVWMCSLTDDRNLARALTRLAISSYKKVPGKGPRAVKVGNACVYALVPCREILDLIS